LAADHSRDSATAGSVTGSFNANQTTNATAPEATITITSEPVGV
jgi:hypothetical protein